MEHGSVPILVLDIVSSENDSAFIFPLRVTGLEFVIFLDTNVKYRSDVVVPDALANIPPLVYVVFIPCGD